MKHPSRLAAFCVLLALVFASIGLAQQPPPPPQATPVPGGVIVITGGPGRKMPISVPPMQAPGVAALQSRISDPFTATLRSDLDYSSAFVVTDAKNDPAGSRDVSLTDVASHWLSTGAEIMVDARGDVAGDRVSVEARVWDLKSRKMIFGRRYSGGVTYVERIAHTLANDILKELTGQTGAFLSTILFVSDRDSGSNKEIYAMDFDGRNQRRLTNQRALVLNPDARGGKVVFTSYAKRFPQLWIMNADGSGQKEVPTGIELNASPSLSPDGSQIAFAGSAKGNTDIYLVNSSGGGLKRLTSTHALEASPDFSPTGRQILYTSDQTGSPQIWVMDAEGTNQRRMTFAGNWNDEASWNPKGDKIAFACRNEGDFNICIMDFATGNTVQLTSEGSNDHPAWSPDGTKIVYQSRRGGSGPYQVYTMDAQDGKNKRQLTNSANNIQPVWLP
jgi:TolB protein